MREEHVREGRGHGHHAAETRLPGGFVSAVVHAADGTVRRTPSPRAEFVRRLLGLFADAGWPGAPRHLGTDGQGRETLSYLDGHVPWDPEAAQPPGVGSDGSLADVACLVRQFHDLTAGTPLAGGEEVVCHNDLSPKNTVYRDRDGAGLRPVALLDWDLAAPGRRVHDIAHVCWQYVPLGPAVTATPAVAPTAGVHEAGVREAGRRVRLVCDAYGLGDGERGELVGVVLWWQERCWRGIAAEAEAGAAHALALREAGAVEAVRDAARWVAAHRRELEAALGDGS